MNLDIQPVILDFLSRRKSVDIPGLGRLFWSVQRSRRGDTSAELHAPGATLLFEQGQNDSSDLLDYVIEKFNISEERAEKWLIGWGSRARKKIEEHGKLDIQAIGTFTKDAQDQINFSMDTALLNRNLELSDMALTPVARDLQLPGVIAVEEGEKEDEERGMLMWLLLNIIIPILLLLAISVMSFFIYRQLTSEPAMTEKVTADEATDEQDQEVAVVDSAKEPEMHQEEDRSVPVAEDSSYREDTTPVHQSTTPELTAEDTASWVEEEIPLGDERTALDTFDKRFCIIIVGSFINSDNARKMIQKVESMGFIVYTESYGRFTRVGVRFDCYETDLYRRLFQLRGTFTEDAWILKYREDGE